MDVLIKNGIVVTAEGHYPADVAIEGEKIAAIVSPGVITEADKIIDAAGKYVVPGAIDTHTHIEEPFQGLTPDEDWTAGTRNAAMGGVTTVLNFSIQDPGAPLLDVIRRHKKRAGELSCIDFNHHGVFSDYSDIKKVVAEIPELFEEGVVSLKAFMIYTADGIYADDWSLYNLMRAMKEYGGFIGLHAENQSIGENMQFEFIDQGKIESKYWPMTKPNFVEAEAVSRACILAEETGCNMYIVHTSTKEAVEIIDRYREKGLPIHSETCAHYLAFDESLYEKEGVGVWEIISPPLRKEADQEALWEGIVNGPVCIMGSDHNAYGKVPKDAGYKEKGFKGVSNGGPGVMEGMGYLFAEGVNKGRLTLERFVEVTSTNAAKMFGLYPQKGTISAGSDADIVLIDPEAEMTFGEALYQDMDWTPYEGMTIKGCPVMTMLRGSVIMENGEFKGGKGQGRFIPAKMNPELVKTIR